MKPVDYSTLQSVSKPARYIGGEVNQVVKPDNEVRARFALAFPDTYEIGMSHAGLKVLYQILNSIPGIWAQRVFAPWHDMAGALLKNGTELFSLEEKRPVRLFDVVGFSLLYELSYTTVLRMLKLARIPLHASERKAGDPIVIAGGTCTVNPTPFQNFFDLVVIGDGEEVVEEMARVCIETRDRGERIAAMAEIEGVHRPGARSRPRRRVLADLDTRPFPSRVVLPHTSIVHDRIGIEVARGCTRGCRFCQAGMIYRPYRERSFPSVMDTLQKSLAATGYDTISMLALSVTDLSYINTIMESLSCPSREVSIGIPSLRVEGITRRVAEFISSVKKPGFTMAPEAATTRLREVINKGNTEEDLIRSVSIIREMGWKALKLYFMVGLPTERHEDIEAICALSRAIASRFKGGLTISVSGFIPKPFTPFQWQEQITPDAHKEVVRHLQKNLRGRNLSLRWQDPALTFLEGVFARGDERLSRVIEEAEDAGAYLDGWGDTFDARTWETAFEKTGVDPRQYLKGRGKEKPLPWEFVDARVLRSFLLKEEERAFQGAPTPDCRFDGCTGCGVCSGKISNIIHGESAPAPLFEQPSGEGNIPYVMQLSKEGPLRFVSPRDYLEMLKRAIRRSGLKAVYTKGFSPTMKLSTSPPSSFGIASVSEFLQFELSEEVDPGVIPEKLNRVLPEGTRVISCRKAKLGLPYAFVYRTDRPFSLDLEPGLTIEKAGKALTVDDYLAYHDDTTMTMLVREGRTISPIAILDAFSNDRLAAWEITKVDTLFAE
jgi:radical SAM family uncharacterized protein